MRSRVFAASIAMPSMLSLETRHVSTEPEPMEGIMIIVTGASGKLGRAVVERLLDRVPATQVGVSVRDPEKVQDLADGGARAARELRRPGEPGAQLRWRCARARRVGQQHRARAGGDAPHRDRGRPRRRRRARLLHQPRRRSAAVTRSRRCPITTPPRRPCTPPASPAPRCAAASTPTRRSCCSAARSRAASSPPPRTDPSTGRRTTTCPRRWPPRSPTPTSARRRSS